jgi:hypothetical protein
VGVGGGAKAAGPGCVPRQVLICLRPDRGRQGAVSFSLLKIQLLDKFS